jgi:hypothetical protein
VGQYIDRNLERAYEPAGFTPDPDIPQARSHMNGLAQLASKLWETPEEQLERGVMTRAAKALKAGQLNGYSAPVAEATPAPPTVAAAETVKRKRSTGRILQCTNKNCGSTNVLDGPCPTCQECGTQIGGCSG